VHGNFVQKRLGHANITMTLDLYSVVHRLERAELDGADEFLH
jgi:integrase